jgi:preprotein translocase subunit SecG
VTPEHLGPTRAFRGRLGRRAGAGGPEPEKECESETVPDGDPATARGSRDHSRSRGSASARRIPVRRSTVVLTIAFIALLLLYLALNPTQGRSATRHTPTSTTTATHGVSTGGVSTGWVSTVSLPTSIPDVDPRDR